MLEIAQVRFISWKGIVVLLSIALASTQASSHPPVNSSGQLLGCRLERQIWPITGFQDRSSADDVSLCTVGSVDRSFAALHLCSQWDGPIAIVFYARSEAEATGLTLFIRETLGPYCSSRSQAVRVKLVGMCSESSAKSDVLPFPVNFLRWNSVTLAETALVLYLDIDFVPSEGAHSRLKESFVNGNLNSSNSVLLLICFKTKPNSLWPKPPGITHRSGSRLQVEADHISVQKLLEQTLLGDVESPGLPLTFFSHGPADYKRFLSLAMSSRGFQEPYQVQYSFWFEPYFVIDKLQWDGIAGEGLFDTRFHKMGGDKAQLSYEVATRGYQFFVQPGAFLVHVPENERFLCEPQLGEICHFARRSILDWPVQYTLAVLVLNFKSGQPMNSHALIPDLAIVVKEEAWRKMWWTSFGLFLLGEEYCQLVNQRFVICHRTISYTK